MPKKRQRNKYLTQGMLLYLDEVGRRIKAKMAYNDIKGNQLATELNINPSRLYEYLNGERDIPLMILLNIADSLNTNITELLGDTNGFNFENFTFG